MPAKLNVNFIHIGYHKAASTWLQKRIFPNVPGLLMCNDYRFDLERPFIDAFIHADPFRFNKNSFLDHFTCTIEHKIGDLSRFSLFGISDENLSGVYLNGMDSQALADRLHDTFGPTSILIVLRNQLDMLLSFYSNYIVHGGVAAFANMPRDSNVSGRRVFNRLKYSGMIEYYRRLFGADKVHVVFFEVLIKESHPLRQLFEGLGVSAGLPESPLEKDNQGRSLFANGVMRQLNRLQVNRRYGQHFAQLFATDRREADRQTVRELFPDKVEEWRQDNRVLANILAVDLPPAYEL